MKDAAGQRVLWGNIRGVIASASLKLAACAFSPSAVSIYPRRYRLGLIEATNLWLDMGLGKTIYPRRYRLGLIEATAG